jgi:LysM repeat protein/Tfp pilus assembly protein PilZ
MNEIATKVFNLSKGGIGIKTNYPISPKERLAVAFDIPDTTNIVSVTGEVAWRQSRRDVLKVGEPVYTAGIKFLTLDEPSRSLISDYIETGGVTMKQRDKIETLKGDFIETLEADFEVDYSDEEGYSVQSKNKKNGFAGKPPGKRVFSFLAGALAVVVIFLIAGFFLRTSNVDSVIKLRSLENRVKQLENRSSRIDWIEAKLDQVEEKNKQFTTFMDTFRKLETPPKISAAQTSEKPTKAVYHEVVAGETIYGISRRYGLTVDELRRLNKLEPEATIYPAQRLLVRPASDR